MRRMAIAQVMHSDAMAELSALEPRADQNMDERDNEVDRLYWLINKQYHSLLRDARLAERLQMTPSRR